MELDGPSQSKVTDCSESDAFARLSAALCPWFNDMESSGEDISQFIMHHCKNVIMKSSVLDLFFQIMDCNYREINLYCTKIHYIIKYI